MSVSSVYNTLLSTTTGTTTSTGTTYSPNISIGDYYTGITCSKGIYHYGGYCNCYFPLTFTASLPIYKYQLKCPSCKTNNWAQIDEIVHCTKCKSTLKAVSKKVDFEIEIED